MTLAEIRDSVQSICGIRWITKMMIQTTYIDELIIDALHKLAGNLSTLESEYTTSTIDGQNWVTIPDSVMAVRSVVFDYTQGSDNGKALYEITKIDASEEIEAGEPDSFWVVSMHNVNKQKMYFDKMPEAGITIKAIFYTWPQSISTDTQLLEINRLWAKAIKHSVAASLLADDPERSMKYGHEVREYDDTMAAIYNVQNKKLYGQTSRFSNLGY